MVSVRMKLLYWNALCTISTRIYVASHDVLLIDPTVILGFEHELYNTSEGIGSIKVCIKVKDGVPQSLLHLSVNTVDGTATGMQHSSTITYAYSNVYT